LQIGSSSLYTTENDNNRSSNSKKDPNNNVPISVQNIIEKIQNQIRFEAADVISGRRPSLMTALANMEDYEMDMTNNGSSKQRKKNTMRKQSVLVRRPPINKNTTDSRVVSDNIPLKIEPLESKAPRPTPRRASVFSFNSIIPTTTTTTTTTDDKEGRIGSLRERPDMSHIPITIPMRKLAGNSFVCCFYSLYLSLYIYI
jgi:hypothetical protein